MRKLRAMRVEVGRGPARRDTWSAENNLPLPYASGRAGNIGAWIPSERPDPGLQHPPRLAEAVLVEATARTLDGRRRSDSNRQMMTWPCEVPNFVYKNKTKKTVYTGGDSIEAQWSSESWAVPKKKKFHSCTLLK